MARVRLAGAVSPTQPPECSCSCTCGAAEAPRFGPAEFVLADGRGVWCGAIVGGTGGQRRACLAEVGRAALATGAWTVFWMDCDSLSGERGFPFDWAMSCEAGLEGALRQLAAVEDSLQKRRELLWAEGGRLLAPSAERPGLLWLINELHGLTGPSWRAPELRQQRFRERLEAVLRRGRKYGIAVHVTNPTHLVSCYGSSTPLRSQLSCRNLAVLGDGDPVTLGVLPWVA